MQPADLDRALLHGCRFSSTWLSMQTSFKPQVMAGLLGVVLLLALLVVGAQAGNRTAATPSTGDTYVEAMVGAPRWVNPLLAMSDTDRDLAQLVFSGLSGLDRNGNLVPDLASGWQTSPDSTVFTFTLRPDLLWQDGSPLTTGDVLFTIGLLQSPDFPGDPALAQPWRSVETSSPSEGTLVFKLGSPNSAFPQYTTLGILPRHIWESVKPSEMLLSPWNLSPIGSGAWRYANLQPHADDTGASEAITATNLNSTAPSLQPSEGVLLVRNSGTPTRGGIQRLWFRLYPTFGAALTGLELGEVHGLGHIPAEEIDRVAAVPGVSMHTQNLARYNMLLMNLDSTLFDRVETRRAVGLAINRGDLLTKQQAPMRPLYSPILPNSWAYNASCSPPVANDIDQARALLDSAGWVLGADGVRARNGQRMTIVVATNADVPLNVAMTQAVVDNLREIGIDARLAAVARNVFLRDYLGPRGFHMVLVGWEAQGVDPDQYAYWHSSQAVTGGLNFAGWENDAADKALEASRAASEQEDRMSPLCDFQSAFAADVPAVILATPLYTYATRMPASGVSLPMMDMLSPAHRFLTLDDWSLQTP